ncbi:hypothetical protein TSOC_008025 [Tetrabaena socialis]|uniref:Uncharacterized protein n=1 Tax=Tetrabaena socialis TaxID=47790 RepID=A0A2J7ZZJ8_9CHLO|nr:hypothetical protein TSOC_008025 [Tetrabaena socialis]|eukprot:PNH05707.1 hypothetical protein TSOC_008025 [Tetrabaena socialis]
MDGTMTMTEPGALPPVAAWEPTLLHPRLTEQCPACASAAAPNPPPPSTSTSAAAAAAASYDWGCGFQPYNCTDLCWDPVNKIKFWGQVSTMLNLDQFLASSAEDARLVILRNRGYLFKLWQEETSDSNPYVVLANSSRLPVHPVTQSIAVYNLVWRARTCMGVVLLLLAALGTAAHLELAPEGGWVPSWRDPCIAAVVVGSTLVSLLVLWLLMSKEQHNSLLREMLPKKVIRQLQPGFESGLGTGHATMSWGCAAS